MAAQKAHPCNPLVESSPTLLPDAKDGNVRLIHRTIEEIIEDKQNETAGVEQDQLARLLSQLESLKEDSDGQLEPNGAKQSEIMSRVNAEARGQKASNHQGKTADITSEEIVRELREVKRQNKITHWLLSVMIAVTLVWQLSEVSLILSVKQQVSHPLKTLGGMLAGFFKRKSPLTTDDEGNSSASSNGPLVEVPQLPSLHMLELPGVNLQSLAITPED